MKNMLDEISEQAVVDWLKLKLLSLQQSGIKANSIDLNVNTYGDQPEAGFTLTYVSKNNGPVISGFRQPTIKAVVADFKADEKAKAPNAAAMRGKAQKLLEDAKKLDGKHAFIQFPPNHADAAAESSQEGRLLPKGRPNPHDA